MIDYPSPEELGCYDQDSGMSPTEGYMSLDYRLGGAHARWERDNGIIPTEADQHDRGMHAPVDYLAGYYDTSERYERLYPDGAP